MRIVMTANGVLFFFLTKKHNAFSWGIILVTSKILMKSSFKIYISSKGQFFSY